MSSEAAPAAAAAPPAAAPPAREVDDDGVVKPIYRHHGVPIAFGSPEKIQAIKDTDKMEFDPSDVLMCGYMRSGTTWHRQILWLILNDADIEKAKAVGQFQRILYLEKGWFMPGEPMPIDQLTQMKSPRTLATHLPYSVLADKINKSGMKVIYMMRNPKDIVTSLYYASTTFAPMIDPKFKQVPWDLLMKYARSENAEMGTVFDHMRGFWEHKDDPNILFLHYEDSRKDHEGAIRKMAKFLGKDLTEKQIKDILDFTSMKTMKETSIQDRPADFFDLKDEKFAFVRKGQIGDWKNHFSVYDNEKYDEFMKEKMKGMEDLKFTFE